MSDNKQENPPINAETGPINAENQPKIQRIWQSRWPEPEKQAQNAEEMAAAAQLDVQLLTRLVERLEGDLHRDLERVFGVQKAILALDENYQAMKEVVEEFVGVLEALDQRITRLEMAWKLSMARQLRPDRQTPPQTEGDRSHPAPQSAAPPHPEAPTTE